MDEQHSGGQQHWESWTASAGQPQPDPQQQGEPAATEQEPGQPEGQTAFTQPIGYPPQGGYDPRSLPPYGYQGYESGASYGQPGGGFGQPGGYYGQPGGYSDPGGYGPPPPPPPGGYYGPPGWGQPGGYGPQRPRRRGLTAIITYLAVAALAATAGGLVVSFADTGSHAPSANPGIGGNPGGGFVLPSNGSGTGGSGGANANISSATVQKVRGAVEPGLVVITSSLALSSGESGEAAAATGMIIDSSGLVLTNNHVISGTTALTATVVGTGRKYTAKWLGFDKSSDVAVIRLLGASGLPTVPIGDSSKVKVGDGVIGLGNAGGTGDISTAVGAVTALNQTITASENGSGAEAERLTGMIQTDAQIVAGDSGGPLASTDGRVIGMDTAASAGQFRSQQDVGFAVPINKALTIARQIIAGKSGSGVQIGASGFVGVLVPSGTGGGQSTETNPQTQLQQQESQPGQRFANPAPNSCVNSADNAGIPQQIAPVSSGTLVLGSICNTPAATAGLVAGDVITSVNGQRVSSPSSLTSLLQTFKGGSRISITWVTPSDQTVTRSLTLGSAPPN